MHVRYAHLTVQQNEYIAMKTKHKKFAHILYSTISSKYKHHISILTIPTYLLANWLLYNVTIQLNNV